MPYLDADAAVGTVPVRRASAAVLGCADDGFGAVVPAPRTWWPCRWTPPIHRSMPLSATWSASPASTRAPVSVRRSAVVRSTGRPAGRGVKQRDAAPAIRSIREAPGVSHVRPRLPRRRADERRPGVGRAVGDGGQDPPLGQRQPVSCRRVLPAEPVERLAQEPQLTPAGWRRSRPGPRGSARGRPPTRGWRARARPGSAARTRSVPGSSRNCSAVSSPRPPKRAMPGVLADADQGDALRRNAEVGQAGEDLDDLQLVVQVRLEPQHVLAVAVGLQGRSRSVNWRIASRDRHPRGR